MTISPFSTITAFDSFLLTDSALAAPLAPAGSVLTVGSGKEFATIEAAVRAASAGDTIQVQAGTYTNDFVSISQNLTLQAVGGTVTMNATTSPPNGKGMIDEGGSGISVTINGFDISGVTVSDNNGAAIRYEGGTLTLNNDYLHNNQEGILAAGDATGNISINNSEIAFNGAGDGYSHNVYVTDIANLTITNSYIHDANRGHEIKSRAENTTITGTRIYDNSAPTSYSIDLPNGGNATIQNDTIEQGSNDPNHTIISYGEEGTLHAGTSVRITGNTIVNDASSATVVRDKAPTPISFTNNQLYGISSSQLGSGVVASGNTYLASRPTLDTSSPTVCFAQGTGILTTRGEVPVESLAEGALIVTHTDQPLPLKWLGVRRIDLTRHPQPNLAAPVRICRDAIAAGQPRRDLWVSPDHCLFLDGRLFPAKLLINDMTIRQERATPAVTYYHVELDRHAVLLAEGLPVESYLDTGNRAFFANAGLALMLHPEFQVNAGLKQWTSDACAPLTVSPKAVEPVWRRLAMRAEALGHLPPQQDRTCDPALRIVVQDHAVRPIARAGRRHAFVLPPGARSVRLVSRAAVPSYATPWLDDWRCLGVAVRRIAVRAPCGVVEIAPDDPELNEGWHGVERDRSGMWRWTDGDATIRLSPCDGPAVLEIEIVNSLAYPVGQPATEADRAAA